jgi:hypothetical protein
MREIFFQRNCNRYHWSKSEELVFRATGVLPVTPPGEFELSVFLFVLVSILTSML